MASSSARRRKGRRRPVPARAATAQPLTAPPARRVPIHRSLFVLPLLAFTLALVAQIAFKAAGADSDSPVRVFLTPLVGATVVLVGMRRYPALSRVRTAVMVAVALFVFALVT